MITEVDTFFLQPDDALKILISILKKTKNQSLHVEILKEDILDNSELLASLITDENGEVKTNSLLLNVVEKDAVSIQKRTLRYLV
jgi:hypothetical protein